MIIFPGFTMAKFQQEGDRVLLPVSVQVHHAVCDGFMQQGLSIHSADVITY